MNFEGYHGTNAEYEPSILFGNFRVSSKLDEWLGTGAYFFLGGISNPEKDACDWAKMRSYDGKRKIKLYHRYIVVKAEISAESVMRLDLDEGIVAFNYFRNQLIDIMKKENIKPTTKGLENDCNVCNFALNHGGYDAIVNCEYIKLDEWTRINRYQSRIATCKIISVKDPKSSVKLKTLTVSARGAA